MTALNGTQIDSVLTLAPATSSPLIGGSYSAEPSDTPVVQNSAFIGVKTFVFAGLGYTPAAPAGQYGQGYGQELWEKVIVNPRTKSLGFVLSTITFQVDVWSTFRFAQKTLTSITVAPGNTVITNGKTPVAIFGPLENAVYTSSVPADGPAALNDTVTFVFTGVSGTDLVITGSRITVFSFEIDWSAGFDEEIEYMTNVMQAYSDMEQRVQLRTQPRYYGSFNVVAVTTQEQALLEAVLYSWQARQFGVPWWMDYCTLTSGISAGASTLPITSTSLKPAFVAGGLVMIWTDAFTWEALTIQTVSTNSILLTSPTTKNWSTGALVVPLRRGRLTDSEEMDHPSSSVVVYKPTFSCEVV